MWFFLGSLLEWVIFSTVRVLLSVSPVKLLINSEEQVIIWSNVKNSVTVINKALNGLCFLGVNLKLNLRKLIILRLGLNEHRFIFLLHL
jgi:hypothetical protein